MAGNGKSTDEPEWLIVGQAGKAHGVHGDFLVEIITDFPDRMRDGVKFGVGDSEAPREFFEVHRVRLHKGRWLLSVRGVRDRKDAESWRGRYLYLPEQAHEDLPDGYFYEHQLKGLKCRDLAGKPVGVVIGVEADDSQTRLVVDRDGEEYLVPYVPAIIREVDLERGVVVVDALPGLLDDEAIEAR